VAAAETGAKRTVGLLPRTDHDAALEQRDVKIRKQAAPRDWSIGGAVVAEREDFQGLPAPEPNLRHVESTVDLELAEATGGEGNFQREIGKFFFLVKAPGFIGESPRGVQAPAE
jgi:hypothetical protein